MFLTQVLAALGKVLVLRKTIVASLYLYSIKVHKVYLNLNCKT